MPPSLGVAPFLFEGYTSAPNERKKTVVDRTLNATGAHLSDMGRSLLLGRKVQGDRANYVNE